MDMFAVFLRQVINNRSQIFIKTPTEDHLMSILNRDTYRCMQSAAQNE